VSATAKHFGVPRDRRIRSAFEIESDSRFSRPATVLVERHLSFARSQNTRLVFTTSRRAMSLLNFDATPRRVAQSNVLRNEAARVSASVALKGESR